MNNINIKRDFYAMATVDDLSAEIVLYGDIVEKRPVDWWTDEPIEGDFIVQAEFMADFEKVSHCQNITIRMNSYGGDAGVAIFIHNRLRELAREGKNLTCIVDGVAMSGGSLIMCACDNVQINPSSLIMIHKCWSFLFGGYNADELREMAKSNDAYDKSQVSIYQRKSGLSETVLLHMMSETTYMTGKEAVDKGFADELLDDAKELDIAASANRQTLFVNGRKMHIAGVKIPDNIPTVKAAEADDNKITTPETPGNNEGGTIMAKTVEELRQEFPELTAQMEADIKQKMEASNQEAVNTAVQAEQDRIKEIDEVGSLFDAALVLEAKYGEKACSAKDLAFRAAQEAKKNGTTFMKNLADDNSASGAQNVGTAPGEALEGGEMTPEQKKAAAKSLLGKKKEA